MPKFAWKDRQHAVNGAAKELNDRVKCDGVYPSDALIDATLSAWARKAAKNVAEMSGRQRDRYRQDVVNRVHTPEYWKKHKSYS